ncbi:uncharacterized protein LOC129733208 isoform X3 [Wyeomyia smithii]|uniref:uncharacterized protein LOC129733208 isoform X3 n=1 Tax=Wyeomyia smithii TaxID=174621 RepID=UPI0024681245|nr:uncharacterized protein LOC129733208 isoform X3 [Wyeomyia smithii]
MTTATVAIQQSENQRRFPASTHQVAPRSSVQPIGASSGTSGNGIVARMNETQQMHTTDSPTQPSNNLSIHNNNNNNNNSSSATKNRSSGQDAKMDHHLQLLQREREREHHHHQQQQQQQQHQSRDSQSSSQSQSQQQQQQQQHHRPLSPTPSEQQYALKWNDFQSSILSSFRHLRDEEDFVDVTIACEQRSFTAHKVVLSACSPYFRKLLKANPCEHPIVILRDVRSEDIESLLRFMYNGEVHIGQDQLSDFLKTAQLLQVRGLADVTNPGRTSNNSSSLLNSSSLSTPAVQELKASPTSTSLPWELPEDSQPAPPPQKRTKSSELFRKQHGLCPDDPIPVDLLPVNQHPLTRDRDRSKDKSKELRDFEQRDRDRGLESLLGQALEGGPTLSVPSKHPDLLSLQNVASGEDSNSSDTAASDHGDDIDGMNGSVERTHPPFPFPFNMTGLIPGPSGMHGDNFDARQHCDTLIKEEANDGEDDDDDDDDGGGALGRQRQRHRRPKQQQLHHHHRHQQQQQQRSCLSASIDGESGGGLRLGTVEGAKFEPDENDSRYMDDEEEDEDGIDDEDMKEDIMSTTMDSDYHKQLAAAGVLAAAAAAASSANGVNHLGDGSEQNDFFSAHKSGSRDLALKQHILNEKARLQAHLQRQQQQLAGFLLSTTAAAATTPPTSTPQNCINQSTSSTTSPFASGTGSLSRPTGSGNTVNSNSVNNSYSHDSKPQKQSQQSQNDRSNPFAYNNSNNSGGQVYLLPCPLCEVPLKPRVFRQHLDRHYPRDSPVCPVIQCGRRFAHPNSVRNHMRLKHTSQWAKMKAMRSSGGPFTGIP